MKLDIAVEKINEGVFRLGGTERQVDLEILSPGLYSLIIDGRSYEASVQEVGARSSRPTLMVGIGAHLIPVRLEDPMTKGTDEVLSPQQEGEAVLSSPMPGRVVAIKVQVDQVVKLGEGLVVVEAMKMENELHSPKAGKVSKIAVKVGDAVEAGQELVVVS